MKKITNSYLCNHLSSIEVLSHDYKYIIDLMEFRKIPLNTDNAIYTTIDWTKVNKKYSLAFDYEGDEIIVRNHLMKTAIINSEKLIIECGYDNPIISIESLVFINNWHDFFAAGAYMGFIGISKEADLFFEFVVNESSLFSNFPL